MPESRSRGRPLAVITGGRLAAADPMTQLEDDDLMRLVSQDDQAAFREIVRRHERSVRAYCGHTLGDGSLADDVAQEVFLDLWRGRARYVGRGKLAAYLCVVARHRCEDVRRRKGNQMHRAGAAGLDSHGPSVSPDQLLSQVIQAQRLARLESALAATTPKLREALVLRFSAGLSYGDIARMTGRSEVTIRSRVLLGIRKLRQLLDIDGGDQ
jgi:RNA polymerase sigma-70 factor, ECF subfamily